MFAPGVGFNAYAVWSSRTFGIRSEGGVPNKKFEKMDKCPICDASRWKDEKEGKKIPEKVLRHFPLIPRLKRMFASKQIA